MICAHCGEWVTPQADKERGICLCPRCGFAHPRRFPPLFVVTGPSGAGKTAVVGQLQSLLPNFEVFETDILWDSAGDWDMVKSNWVRIADSLAQRPHPRFSILCGTIGPEEVRQAGADWMFSAVHFAALVCNEATLTARLRARPSWRGCNESFIEKQIRYQHYLWENQKTAFDPPLHLIDTSTETAETTARALCEWVSARSQTRA